MTKTRFVIAGRLDNKAVVHTVLFEAPEADWGGAREGMVLVRILIKDGG